MFAEITSQLDGITQIIDFFDTQFDFSHYIKIWIKYYRQIAHVGYILQWETVWLKIFVSVLCAKRPHMSGGCPNGPRAGYTI